MIDETKLEEAVAAYCSFFETLKPETLQCLDMLCHPNVRFRDPFNDVVGVASFRAALGRMFEDTREPAFVITDRAISHRTVYLRWTFSFRSKKTGAPWTIDGMSEVHFDDTDRVTQHLDHWDSGSQFYGRLPVLRHVIGMIRRRLALKD
ncbi:MAG: nuclear transport factor 2 family protein [Pseudomonadota bacterium]